MAYNENINLFVTTDRNSADVFNAPLEKIIQNIQNTREYLNQLQVELDQLESKVQSEYTPTEQLNDLLAKGIKGDKGDTGEGLEYNWDGTALGVKLESESDFTYRELKGEPGDVSTEQLEETLTDYPTLEYLEEALQDYATNIANLTNTMDLYMENVADTYATKASVNDKFDRFKDDVAMTYATQSELNNLAMDIGDNVKPSIATNTTNIANLTTKVNNNIVKTTKDTAKFSSQSAFSPILSSCIIGNNTVGAVWIFTGYISYNINSAPSAGSSILSINRQMTQCEDVTIVCPCMTANNAYITLKVSGGTLYYQSYTGSAPTSGSRYFVSAAIPVTSTSLLS